MPVPADHLYTSSLRHIQTSASGFVASIINTNQRVNCGPGPQVWSANYTYAGQQVCRSAFYPFCT